jgi:hypothetical protein
MYFVTNKMYFIVFCNNWYNILYFVTNKVTILPDANNEKMESVSEYNIIIIIINYTIIIIINYKIIIIIN